VTNHQNNLTIVIKRKPNWFVFIITGIWSLGWLGLMLTITYGLITDKAKGSDGELIFFSLLFFFAGLFIFRIFLWHLRGKEIVTVNHDELTIQKKGTIFSSIRKFEIEFIDDISQTLNSTTPRWILFWGHSGGQIQFSYLGRAKYFGQTLDPNEAKEIITKVKDKLKTTTRNS
jgi:hypothetical protein